MLLSPIPRLSNLDVNFSLPIPSAHRENYIITPALRSDLPIIFLLQNIELCPHELTNYCLIDLLIGKEYIIAGM